MNILISTRYEIINSDGDTTTHTATTAMMVDHPTLAFDAHEEKIGAIERRLVKNHHSEKPVDF